MNNRRNPKSGERKKNLSLLLNACTLSPSRLVTHISHLRQASAGDVKRKDMVKERDSISYSMYRLFRGFICSSTVLRSSRLAPKLPHSPTSNNMAIVPTTPDKRPTLTASRPWVLLLDVVHCALALALGATGG
jgi:hypothetical protein